MGKLRDRMIEDLQLRDYARGTRRAYVDCARAFVAYHRRPPEQMGEEEVRQFLMHRNPSASDVLPTACGDRYSRTRRSRWATDRGRRTVGGVGGSGRSPRLG